MRDEELTWKINLLEEIFGAFRDKPSILTGRAFFRDKADDGHYLSATLNRRGRNVIPLRLEVESDAIGVVVDNSNKVLEWTSDEIRSNLESVKLHLTYLFTAAILIERAGNYKLTHAFNDSGEVEHIFDLSEPTVLARIDRLFAKNRHFHYYEPAFIRGS